MTGQDAVAVIVAAGRGTRMEAGSNKLLLPLSHQTILEYAIQPFLRHPCIKQVYLVVAGNDREIITQMFTDEPVLLVEGGPRRQDSVHHALETIDRDKTHPGLVVVHDGARPFCTPELIELVLRGCREKGSAIPVVPLTDTIRRIKDNRTELMDRSHFCAVQTPQGFQWDLLWEASCLAREKNWVVTDDASMLERNGLPVHTVPGDQWNLKITTNADLAWARWKVENMVTPSTSP